MKPHSAIIHYLAITTAIVAVCYAQDDNTTVVDLVNVDVYYETLCPDSIRFVGTQLVPAFEEIGDYINVTYVPYGKATHELITDEDGNSQWNFTCQHGPEECYGNKAQACAINEILTNSETSDVQQLRLVNFVGCSMTADNPAQATALCLATMGMSLSFIFSVANCILTSQGDELLAGHGNKTHALEPALTFVPTIVINEVFTQENQDDSLSNFQGVICQNIPTENRPLACNVAIPLSTQMNVFAIAIFSVFFCIGKGSNYFL